ncbi:MAG: LTA synthase family protein [Lachnospiraceae bacterium]|nr:LTA synthase family protein [Lachnospiraceae bacterium]
MKNISDILPGRLRQFIPFLVPVLLFYGTQYELSPIFGKITFTLQLVNIILFELIALGLFCLIGRLRAALWTECGLIWVFATVDAYLYEFRGSFIMPWDLLTIATAMKVADNYDYAPTETMIVGSMVVLAAVLLVFLCPDLRPKALKSFQKRLAGFGLVSCIIVSLTVVMQQDAVAEVLDIHDSLFQINAATKKNGMLLGFLYKTKYLIVDAPEGYSHPEVEKIIADAPVSKGPQDGQLPDIIVIMNEAMSDPKVDGDFEANTDYLPFIHSLEEGHENTITGYLNVSVNGGKTPNTEFEFLTGNSMAFLPEGSIPFQTYISHKIDAMPHYLKSLGYSTLAMHPYDADGWRRNLVYPLLGFDDMHFKDYFKKFEYVKIRDYVSDECLYHQIEYELEHRAEPDKPMFNFNVTMQNHSGYKGKYDNFVASVTMNGTNPEESESAQKLGNYLSLMKYSDEAFEDFIEYMEKSDRPAIVVTFGDHQPSPDVLEDIYKANGEDYENLSEEATTNLYRVPFVVWANFPIEERHGIETSANYLGNMLLKEAGIALTRYRERIDEYEKEYPVVTAIRSVDKNGRSFEAGKRPEGLDGYARLEYYEIFDDNDSYY